MGIARTTFQKSPALVVARNSQSLEIKIKLRACGRLFIYYNKKRDCVRIEIVDRAWADVFFSSRSEYKVGALWDKIN